MCQSTQSTYICKVLNQNQNVVKLFGENQVNAPEQVTFTAIAWVVLIYIL